MKIKAKSEKKTKEEARKERASKVRYKRTKTNLKEKEADDELRDFLR